MGCNLGDVYQVIVNQSVSVPSTGRSGLQLSDTSNTYRVQQRFSTLYGSKWVATQRALVTHTQTTCFSTLYGSKWVATQLSQIEEHLGIRFQYPLRVEVGCNLPSARHDARHAGFQYPLRVEVGCNTTRRLDSWLPCGFQYPLRVEVGCNLHQLTLF